MSAPDPWKPSRYSPTPGTERCPLCREMRGKDHVTHPWSQILGWLWASSMSWRLMITTLGLVATVSLAVVIAFVRTLILGS